MNPIALIGSTACGKSNLALKFAHFVDAYILSLDSLSVYAQIDIVSAKPSQEDRSSIKHFGIDVVMPDEIFSVMTFVDLYDKAYEACLRDGKQLVIVGGTSFYLKSLIDGISPIPKVTQAVSLKANEAMQDPLGTYENLRLIDENYMSQIEPNDAYRVRRAFEIYEATQKPPSEYFADNPKVKISQHVDIYLIDTDRTQLADNIAKRTLSMMEQGLVQEVTNLVHTYQDRLVPKKAIGIKETVGYLEGLSSKDEMLEMIMRNTRRLAKRQRTFNNTQFSEVTRGSGEEILKILTERYG